MFDLFVKTLAKWYFKQCILCKTTRFEATLNSFSGKIECPECKKQIIFGRSLLKILMYYMDLDFDDLNDLTSYNEAIPLINAFLRDATKHGFTTIKVGLPLYVVFDITNKCNLKCIHCYSSTKKDELTTDEVYRIIDMLYKAGTGIIDFGGGEPLLRDDIFQILQYSKKVGLFTSISTNGLLLNNDFIKRLKKLEIDQICISLDGEKKETHDYIRNKKGTYEKAINGIKNCVKTGINTQISTVIMKSNFNELVEIYNLLNFMGVNGWYVYDFIPAGRGKDLQNETLDTKKRHQLFLKLEELARITNLLIKPYPYSITINSACGKDSYFYQKYGKLTEFFKGCLAARWVCHISSNGDLHPCFLLPQKLGNLKQDTFRDIWYDKNNPVLKDLRDRTLLKGNCGICKYRDVCGGCRARAYWNSDDYLESDNCWIQN